MTPLEAAKALSSATPIVSFWDTGGGHWACWCCQGNGDDDPYGEYDEGHKPDCPVPMLAKIVAALEAADAVADEHPLFIEDGMWKCPYCHGEQSDTPENEDTEFPHDDDCSGERLVAALKGERA